MAALAPSFWTESKVVHNEHQALIEDLNELDYALDGLECYSEVFANFATAGQVLACGGRVAKLLPEHFSHEEQTVLAGVAKVSPELAEFAGEMRAQGAADGAVVVLDLQDLPLDLHLLGGVVAGHGMVVCGFFGSLPWRGQDHHRAKNQGEQRASKGIHGPSLPRLQAC